VSNKLPYVVLELDEVDAHWLLEKLYGAEVDNDAAFKEFCSMPSSDPRSTMRAAMTFRLANEAGMFEGMRERFIKQQPDLQKVIDKLNDFIDRRKDDD
jgi:hypothetical protein